MSDMRDEGEALFREAEWTLVGPLEGTERWLMFDGRTMKYIRDLTPKEISQAKEATP